MSIILEHLVLPSPEQMEFVVEGMRNPMNSWERSDTNVDPDLYSLKNIELGENDHSLMQRLSNAGTEHRKYMRMMPVYVRVTAPLYWWKEFDTYKVGTVANSCSTMHKIQEKEFTLEDFSYAHLSYYPYDRAWITSAAVDEDDNSPHKVWATPLDILRYTIEMLNIYRSVYLETKDKNDWWQMIQLLPSSYNQTRNVMLNYEVLANIYKQRRDHKLDEWRELCKWIEENLPYSELITGFKECDTAEYASKHQKWHDMVAGMANPDRPLVEDIKRPPVSSLLSSSTADREKFMEEQLIEWASGSTDPFKKLADELRGISDEEWESLRRPYPWGKEDNPYCDKCKHFHDCFNSGGLVDVTTGDDIAKDGYAMRHYINKPWYDCPKED